jgi:phospholipase C
VIVDPEESAVAVTFIVEMSFATSAVYSVVFAENTGDSVPDDSVSEYKFAFISDETGEFDFEDPPPLQPIEDIIPMAAISAERRAGRRKAFLFTFIICPPFSKR